MRSRYLREKARIECLDLCLHQISVDMYETVETLAVLAYLAGFHHDPICTDRQENRLAIKA